MVRKMSVVVVYAVWHNTLFISRCDVEWQQQRGGDRRPCIYISICRKCQTSRSKGTTSLETRSRLAPRTSMNPYIVRGRILLAMLTEVLALMFHDVAETHYAPEP